MEPEDIKFRRRYEKTYKLEYDLAIDEQGRYIRTGVFIPSRLSQHKDGQRYDVCPDVPGKLTAIMPVQKSRNLVKKYPFLEVVPARDCWVLSFDEKMLSKVASDMGLRKRRQLPPEERDKLVKAGASYRFK